MGVVSHAKFCPNLQEEALGYSMYLRTLKTLDGNISSQLKRV